jgi:hypothetical protein
MKMPNVNQKKNRPSPVAKEISWLLNLDPCLLQTQESLYFVADPEQILGPVISLLLVLLKGLVTTRR